MAGLLDLGTEVAGSTPGGVVLHVGPVGRLTASNGGPVTGAEPSGGHRRGCVCWGQAEEQRLIRAPAKKRWVGRGAPGRRGPRRSEGPFAQGEVTACCLIFNR